MRFENVHFRAYREGRLTASGEAAEFVYFRNSGELVASTLGVDLPQEGSAPARITAPRVVGDVPGRSFEGRGGLLLLRGSDEVRTESARYLESDGLVRGDLPVEVRGPGFRLTGPAFTLDPRSGELDVRGGARLLVTPAAGPRGPGAAAGPRQKDPPRP